MKTIRPDSSKAERLFKTWHSVDPQRVVDGSGLELPAVLWARGKLVRTWYESDRATPDSPKGVWTSWVHCVQVDTDAGGGPCLCGHAREDHDEMPRSFGTVYDADGPYRSNEQLQIEWPRHCVFLGYVRDFDIGVEADASAARRARLGESVLEQIRFKKLGLLVALDDRAVAIVREDGKVYVVHGGELRVERRGLIG